MRAVAGSSLVIRARRALACASVGLLALAAAGALTSTLRADGTPDLLARMAPLESEAPGADAAEVLAQARRALAEASTRRGAGDEAGARRAEAIAEAAVLVAERRIGAARARRTLSTLEAQVAAATQRLRLAREARDRAREERARLLRAAQAPAPESAADDDAETQDGALSE